MGRTMKRRQVLGQAGTATSGDQDAAGERGDHQQAATPPPHGFHFY
jgi:hypothetical protein